MYLTFVFISITILFNKKIEKNIDKINTLRHNLYIIELFYNIMNKLYYFIPPILFLLLSITIFFPYYYINYVPSQNNNDHIIETICIVLNQTFTYKYSCYKKFYHCGCNIYYYYPCDYAMNYHIQNYCCDPICTTNITQSSLNYITCGYDTIIETIIENYNNIINTFIVTCKFDDNSCVNYWINLKIKNFTCYYDDRYQQQILLSRPEVIELYSIGFIFTYIFFVLAFITVFISIYYYKKENKNYIVLN